MRRPRLKLSLWKPILRDAQRGFCYLCQCPVGIKRGTIDHVVPLSKGGSPNIGNLMLVHDACNKAKNDREPTELELRKLAHVNRRIGLTA